MEKHQIKFINQNLAKLVGCTKNEPALSMQLIQENFISHNTWQKIKAENPDFESRMTELYCECLKTPNYDALIQCMEESDNDAAAAILKKITTNDENCVRTTSPSATSIPGSQSVPAPTSVDYGFVVEDKHIKWISKILNETLASEEWEDVKNNWLSQKMRNDIGKQSSMRLDITVSLRVWQKGTTKAERLFSKILEAFEDYETVTDKLKEEASSTS